MLHWTDQTMAKIVRRIEARLAVLHPISDAFVPSWAETEVVDIPVSRGRRTSHFVFSSLFAS